MGIVSSSLSLTEAEPSLNEITEAEYLFVMISEWPSQSVGEVRLPECFQKHFCRKEYQKVEDFPSDCSLWINTATPISIHRDLRGKLILLHFFTYSCSSDMPALSDLQFLKKKYTVEDGLVVIGVHSAKFDYEKEMKIVASSVRRNEIDHAVINDSERIIRNACNTTWPSREIWDSCDFWPTFALIGPYGEFLLPLYGTNRLQLLDYIIEVALRVMREKNILSSHALPQIEHTEESKSFDALLFPGKVASCITKKSSLIGISDTGNHRILIVDDEGTVQFAIGGLDAGFKDGDFSSCKFRAPQGLVFMNAREIYVADTENHAIRAIDLFSRKVTTVAGTGKRAGEDWKGGNLWTEQAISSPWDVCFGEDKNILLIAMAGHRQIWALYLDYSRDNFYMEGKRGECKAIAGSGFEMNANHCYPHSAKFAQPSAIDYCPNRGSIFIADSGSSTIRELNLNTGKVSAVVGGDQNRMNLLAYGDADGVSYHAKLQHPSGVAWHTSEKMLYVADSFNHKLKKVNVIKKSCSTERIPTDFDEPGGICTHGNKIIIADTKNHSIKIYDPQTSLINTMSITFREPNFREPREELIMKPLNEEKTIEISEGGGILNVQISLKTGQDVTLSNYHTSPFWLINFYDENLWRLRDREIRANLKLKSSLRILVPSESSQQRIRKVLIEGRLLYTCKEDSQIGSMEKLRFIIDLRYSETAGGKAFCDFSHVINGR